MIPSSSIFNFAAYDGENSPFSFGDRAISQAINKITSLKKKRQEKNLFSSLSSQR